VSKRPTLRLGDDGSSVHELHQDLLERGFVILSEELEDDHFGDSTARAVETYQGSHGLVADRIVGPKTWAMLGRVERPTEVSSIVIPQLAPGFSRAERALVKAHNDLLDGVHESPPHSNRSPRIDEMTRFRGAPALPGPRWCCYAVSDWWDNAFRFGGVSSLIKWARNRGLLIDPSRGDGPPQAGDIFFTVIRDRDGVPKVDGGRHVGLTAEVEGADTFFTIEGNSGDRVRSLVRPVGLHLFARVPDAAFN